MFILALVFCVCLFVATRGNLQRWRTGEVVTLMSRLLRISVSLVRFCVCIYFGWSFITVYLKCALFKCSCVCDHRNFANGKIDYITMWLIELVCRGNHYSGAVSTHFYRLFSSWWCCL